jgi:hypothetical protein
VVNFISERLALKNREPRPKDVEQRRTWDNFIYLAVGLGIAGLVAADFFYADSHGQEMWLPSKFAVRSVYTTLLLVFFVVKVIRRLKATMLQTFACISFAIILHLGIVFSLRETVGNLTGSEFSGFAFVEMAFIVLMTEPVIRYLTPRPRTSTPD